MAKKDDKAKPADPNQRAIDWEAIREGRRLRDEGIDRAVSAAEREKKDWSSIAYDLFLKFVERIDYDRPFMNEEVRVWALNNYDFQTPRPHAWGAIPMRAAKNGFIEQLPTSGTSLDPKQHRGKKNLWVRKRHPS